MTVLLTNIMATLLIAPALFILWTIRVSEYQASWIIHGIFAFLLTLLIFGAYLRGKYVNVYLLSFFALAVGWEIVEVIILGGRVENSVSLTVFDTIMDLICGLMGVGIGICAISLVRKFLTTQ